MLNISTGQIQNYDLEKLAIFLKISSLGIIHSCVDQTLNAPFCIVVVLINEGYAY